MRFSMSFQKFIAAVIFCFCLLWLSNAWSSSLPGSTRSPLLPSLPPFEAETVIDTKSGAKLGSHAAASTPASLHAKASCVLDADSGRILYANHADDPMPMASTTKIMTCLLALENGQADDTVSVSSYAASMPDVQLNIRAGESYRLGDLLYSLMLESHNDSAVAIAEYIGGSVENFAAMMNEKARELGCTNTHFVTPNGLDDKAHYTTARELCLIASCAMQNKTFRSIIATPSYSFHSIDQKRSFTVRNHDAFLTSYPGALGIKTGFTGNAGYCFCGAARRNGRTLICAVLACGWPPNKSYKWLDTTKLMNYGFDGFETVSIPVRQTYLSVPAAHSPKHTLTLKRSTLPALTYPLAKDDVVETTLTLPDYVVAPVRSGDIIGYEKYAVNGTCIAQIPLTASSGLPAVHFTDCCRQLLRILFSCYV